MTSVKTAILSSLITLIVVSLSFIYMYSKDNNDISESDSSTNNNFITNPISQDGNQDRNEINTEIYNQRRNIITETVKKVSPAVVGINVKEIRQYRSPWSNDPFWRFFYGSGIHNREVQGIGSGYIISSDGYIVTNDHVAGTADQITVTLSNGRQLEAKIVGSDLTTDICLLKVDETNLPYVEFGNSDDVIIGEWAIAVGNPFGLFSQSDNPTVTVGVVSATGMNLSPLNNRYYMDMVQTDASINQGNSGGPLVNSTGQMIGMNTIIYTAEGSSGNVGVGFAIPVNKIKKVVNELKSSGKFDREYWTGLRIQNVDQGIADYFNLSRVRGVFIKEVMTNSPGAKAGLQPYDIITELNRRRVDNSDILFGMLQDYKTGETVELTILRDNSTFKKKMKLEKRND